MVPETGPTTFHFRVVQKDIWHLCWCVFIEILGGYYHRMIYHYTENVAIG